MAAVIVYHDGYGCMTGCCGHRISVDGVDVPHSFTWDHPENEDLRAWAESLIREQGCEPSDLDWESCIIVEDHI